MSNERPAATADRSRGSLAAAGDTLDALAARRGRIVHVAGLAALVAVGGHTTLEIARNLPTDPVVVPQAFYALVTAGVPVVVGVSTVAVALATRRDAVRVGLLFAGAFGVLTTVAAAATLPATAAVVGGGAVALAGVVGRPRTYRDVRRAAIAAAVVAGVALTLASTTGLLVGTRGLGGSFALAAIAALVVRADGDRLALAAGALAVAGVVVASATAPFVVGSALLVGFAVVGVPHLLAALALGGATAAVVAGLRRREDGLAIGTTLLLLAGVPTTVPTATAVVLGATLALGSPTTLVDGVGTGRQDAAGVRSDTATDRRDATADRSDTTTEVAR